MPKKSKADPPAVDDALASASPEQALAALEQAGPTLIDEWLRRGNAAAILEVAERAQGAPRKAARRAINVLKSRGVAIPERRRVVSLSSASHVEAFEAWMLAPDTAGTLVLVIAVGAPASRYRAAFVVLHDDQGLFRVDVGEPTHSQLKESMARILPGAQYKPVRVPLDWARYRVEKARKLHVERKAPLPLGITSAKSLLEPIPSAEPDHPFDAEGLELAIDDAREMAQGSVVLHALPEFRGWFPPNPAVDELLNELGKTMPQGGEQPDPGAMRQVVEEQVRAATDRWFSPQRRTALVRAMKDSALSVLSRDGEVKALEVVAAMKAIGEAGLITNPPHEVPFLRAFFEKALSLLLTQGGGRLRIPLPYRPIEDVGEPELPSDAATTSEPEGSAPIPDEPPLVQDR